MREIVEFVDDHNQWWKLIEYGEKVKEIWLYMKGVNGYFSIRKANRDDIQKLKDRGYIVEF